MFDVIIPAAGKSVRTGFDKLNAKIGTLTVLQRAVNAFLGVEGIGKIIVVGDADLFDGRSDVTVVKGGETRSESVKNGLAAVTAEYVLIHDGARPFVDNDLIKRVMNATLAFGSAIPCLPVTDTLMEKDRNQLVRSADRERFASVQTPQGFRTEQLRRAFSAAQGKIDAGKLYTDESSLYAEFIAPCRMVDGSASNKKITYESDFYGITARVGTGFDLHKFIKNKPLRLCGTDIPYEYGLLAHSDGDVAIHALMDALLTAVGERDIGVLFPDDDPAYENINSVVLLSRVTDIVSLKNAVIKSVNIVIIAQTPKLSPYIEKMRQNIAAYLGITPDSVGISATTTENVGIIGENKAIAAFATVTLI